jgi:hypothetical protein
MIGANKLKPFGGSTLDHHLDENWTMYGSLWVVAACLVALATLLMPGCGNSSVAHPVDAPQALDALKIALDAWKKGETSQSLASGSPPMTVQDFEWDTGAKLIEYRLVDDGRADGPNLRIQVMITTSGEPAKGQKQAKPTEKKASYVVGTSPRLTVFRDIMRR